MKIILDFVIHFPFFSTFKGGNKGEKCLEGEKNECFRMDGCKGEMRLLMKGKKGMDRETLINIWKKE